MRLGLRMVPLLALIGAEARADALTLGQVLSEARAERREVRAARAQAEASSQVPLVQRALPDPMVMGGVDHLPFSFMGANWNVQLQQDFPLSRVLAHRETSATRRAEARAADVSTRTLDVELAAARSFLMLAEAQRMVRVITGLREVAAQVQAAVQARLSTAQATPSEAVRAEVELARLQAEAEALEREVVGAWAMTEASMGHPQARAEVPVAQLDVAADAPVELEVLLGRAAQRPELARMRGELEAARADIRAMESMYAPMAFVRLGAAGTMSEGPGAMAMVGVTLPLWREKLGAGVAEASAMRTMAESELVAMQTMIDGEVRSSQQRVLAARARFLLTRERVVPLARQSVELALRAYASGQLPLVSVLDALRARGDTEMDAVRAEVQLAAAQVELERATGTLGGSP